MELTHVIWMFLIVFVLHDLEEIIAVENWLIRHRERLVRSIPAFLQKTFQPMLSMSTAQFSVAVTCIFAVLSAAVLLTVLTWPAGTYLPFFLVCLHVLFLHVFTHIGQSLLFRTYTPGVVTAVVLVLPYSLYTYYRLFAEGWVSWSMIGETLPYSLLVIPVLYAALTLGEKAIKPLKS